jgi:lipoprotein-anchoring transpeptidase ErfK/SrfK
VLLLVAAGIVAGCGRSVKRSAARVSGDLSVIASPTTASLAVFAHPGDAAPSMGLPDRTPLGSARVLLVQDARGPWLQVLLPSRPNGARGWVRRQDVQLTTTTWLVVVDRAAHLLTATRDGKVIASGPVATGAPGTPTPAGTFFVTDVLAVPSDQPFYGPKALGLSGYSPTLSSFEGGDAQVALHGTDHPELLGRSVSHGCIRLGNELVTKLAQVLPLGTPVVVR